MPPICVIPLFQYKCQADGLFIVCCVGLFDMQIYFKSAGPFCARAALRYIAALCSRIPEL